MAWNSEWPVTSTFKPSQSQSETVTHQFVLPETVQQASEMLVQSNQFNPILPETVQNQSANAFQVQTQVWGKEDWDTLDRDQLLLLWQEKKDAIVKAKADEMELRKYIVANISDVHEGTNTVELGNGYQLKAVVKFNYKLADNDVVEKGLDAIAATGNQGTFIADRLVGWTPNFHLSEYRTLQEEAEKGSGEAIAILKIVNSFLTIEDAAPDLKIKEPKK